MKLIIDIPEETANEIARCGTFLNPRDKERLQNAFNNIKPLNAVPQWIPVSERLPKDRNTVLVTAYWHETYQVMEASWYDGDDVWWCVPFNNCGEHMRNDLHVIAWMPLPEPYKAESEE